MANTTEGERPREQGDSQAPSTERHPQLNTVDLMRAGSGRRAAAPEPERCIPDPSDTPEPPKGQPPIVGPVERSFGSFELLRSSRPFDPSKPTVAVLDDFRRSVFAPNGPDRPGLSHGEVSAAAAEQAGFNVLRLHTKSEDTPMDQTLGEIYNAIGSGQLRMKKGDALNISLGLEIKFSELSCALKMNVTPENYASMVKPIRERMEQIAATRGRGLHPADAERLTGSLDVQDLVKEFQRRGIDIVHSAGNEGPNEVEIDMMYARKQLSATDPQGRIYDFSANHSLTQPYRGAFEMRYHGANFFDGRPVAQQPGYYQLDTTRVRFPAEQFGGFQSYNRFKFLMMDGKGDPMYITPQDVLTSEHLRPQVESGASPLVPGAAELSPYRRGRAPAMQGLSEPLPDVPLAAVRPQSLDTLSARWDRLGRAVETIAGTSFSNVTYWEERMRLIQEQRQSKRPQR